MNLTYIGYSQNGLGNQFSSLQLFAGLLGHLKDTNINLVWDLTHRNIEDPQSASWNKVNTEKIDKHLNNLESPTIFDLVDFNYDNYTLHKNDYFLKDRSSINLINTHESYLNVSGNTINEKDFAGTRKKVEFKQDCNNLMTNTLMWYSRFFYDRSKDIDVNLSKFRFKQEYYDIAEKIAKHYGNFNGTQIRIMPDHHKYYKFTQDTLNQGLDQFDNKSLPILCSIDDFNSNLIDKNKLILLEDIILGEFLKDFKQLRFQNRVTVALISALVMSMADDFVGTPFSTFSTMIHQLRNNNGDDRFKYYPSKNPVFDNKNTQGGHYSWSRLSVGTWERDWKESKLNA